ncbi:MAG: hypothetical protein L0H26_10355, partial [Microlunatus sp.]|nr:hypothetical protein [Microlunatus sp.]
GQPTRDAFTPFEQVVLPVEAGDGTTMIQSWLPMERLTPVRSDPNHVLRYWHFSELNRPPRPAS